MDKGSKSLAALIASVGTICAFGGYSLLSSGGVRNHSELESRIAAAKKIGMPIDAADLQSARVPFEQNAAPIYRKADLIAKSLSKAQGVVDADSLPNSNPGVDKAIGELEPLLSELEQVRSRPKCDFGRDWNQGAKLMLPEFSGMKRDVRDLCRSADLQDRRGDFSGTLKSMELAFDIAAQAGCDPIIISLLVENSAQAIVTTEWQQIAQRHSHDDRILAQIQTALESKKTLPQVRKYLGGEIVMGRITIQTLSSVEELGIPGSSGIPDALINAPGMRTMFETKFLIVWSKAWTEFPADPNDWAGYSTVLKSMDVEMAEDSSVGNTLNRILMPVFSQAGDSVGVQLAHWNLLKTSLAVLRIRNSIGHYPAVLPPNLASEATDPFDGGLLRYRPDAGGFTLYSIGADRVDNGGIRAADAKQGRGFDEVFQMS